jgi:DNA-binding XRE family transcriptional regulator
MRKHQTTKLPSCLIVARCHNSFPMTPAAYKAMRKIRGTQERVAALLGVERSTVARRETGVVPISTETAIALAALPPKSRNNPRHQ